MKQYLKNKIKGYHFLVLAGIIGIAVTGCVYLDSFSVTQIIDGKEVNYAYANTEATFTITGHIECHEDHNGVNFVVAFLVPKSWNVLENGKVTYKCDLAEDHDMILNMSPVPTASLPKNGGGRTWVECLTQEYKVGTNVLDDMEWVVYQTNEKWNIINNQFPYYTVWLKTNVGEKNLKCYLGAFVNHTDDGFGGGVDHKKVTFSPDRFEVIGGKGPVIDFCDRHYNKVSPMTSLQNDLVTLTFNGDIADNQLASMEKVYVNGTAYDDEGNAYELTEKSERTLMTRENAYSNTFNITVWPIELFNMPVTAQMTHFDYYFTNADGTVRITKSHDDYVIDNIKIPANEVPFTFTFECE